MALIIAMAQRAWRHLSKIVRFLLFSNLWVAMSYTAFAGASLPLLGLRFRPSDGANLTLIFFAVLMVYLLDRLVDPPDERLPERQAFWGRHRRLLKGMIVLSALGVLLPALTLPLRGWLLWAPAGTLALAYSLPTTGVGWRGLRWVPYLKVFLIAAVWSYAGLAYVAVPGWERVSPETLGWLGLVRFFWVLAITIPFDMRDVVSDVQAGIVTLPSRLGLRTSWYISLLAAAVSLVGALAWLPSLPGAPGMWLSYAGLFPVLLAWHIRRGEAYYAYLLDGSVAWQALCIFVQAGF